MPGDILYHTEALDMQCPHKTFNEKANVNNGAKA